MATKFAADKFNSGRDHCEYAGRDAAEQERQCGLMIDRVRLPADQSARI
jgi:hypothetical protein